jgi:hypothetical protein
VTFEIDAINSGYTSTIDEAGYLSGYYWLGNVGWSTFNHLDSTCRAQIVCPTDILRNPNQLCLVAGCTWSKNAGWTVLKWSDIGASYTGVYYNPGTTLIEWFAWNRGLGWIPFYAEMGTPISAITQTGISTAWLGVNFIGKIAIIGNIAGTRIFELPNQNVGYVYTTTNHASIMNTINKNLSIMSRNISDSILSDELSGLDFLVTKSSDYIFDFNKAWPTNKRTIAVIGRDIILDQADINPGATVTRWLIALKDANGSGGNIIITEKVKRIYSYIYAEGSIYSGEKVSGNIIPYVNSWALNMPTNQLYIKWVLISKNTIGWAQQTIPVCPIVINNCSQTIAETYDLNFFRTFDYDELSQRSIPYPDPRLDRAPLVVEYDPSILSDTPPWLANTLQ